MDIKKYLIEQIKKCQLKMNLAKLIDFGVLAAAVGGIGGILCELASFVWQFYYVHLAAGLCFGAGLLIGLGYAVYRGADMKQAARRLDSFGLKERMITAYEQIQMEEAISSKNEFVQRQREDALKHYERIREQIKIPLWPDKRHILALLLSVAVVIGMGMIPSAVREQARIRHQVQEQAMEEKETMEELLEALKGVDMESLTEEQKAQLKDLQEAMKLSQEELAKANSWESLASALEKLDYKYEQAGQSLNRLASQLENPEAAGIAAAEALAKAAANQNGSQMASAGMTASANPSSGEGNTGDGSGENAGNGNGQSDGNGSDSESGDNSGNGNSSGSGDNSGNGGNSGNGNGSGNGDGSGSGEGAGSGNGGNGSGRSGGNGRGTGSSTAVHDYVSVPNAVGNDSSLTGNKNGDQDSDYYRQQNGLAWEGEHVDYNSVIGEYTNNAYEGIANNRYPSGMESVIRDYFEKLNK